MTHLSSNQSWSTSTAETFSEVGNQRRIPFDMLLNRVIFFFAAQRLLQSLWRGLLRGEGRAARDLQLPPGPARIFLPEPSHCVWKPGDERSTSSSEMGQG